MGAAVNAFRALTDEEFDRRMQNWAIWCQNGRRGAYAGYTCPLATMMARTGGHGSRALVGAVLSDDQEQEIERCVMCLAAQDLVAAEVIRAEYKAHPRYGQADGAFSGRETRERTCKQLKISMRTYEGKLQLGRMVIRTSLMAARMPKAAKPQASEKW